MGDHVDEDLTGNRSRPAAGQYRDSLGASELAVPLVTRGHGHGQQTATTKAAAVEEEERRVGLLGKAQHDTV